MKISKALLAVGFKGGAASVALLLGACNSDAPPEKDVPETSLRDLRALATSLSLPVNGSAYYYNRATSTAFRETCEALPDRVRCRLDVLGMIAQIDHVAQTDYTQEANGSVKTDSVVVHQNDWMQESTMLYNKIKANPQKLEWAAGWPLARVAQNQGQDIVQNNIAEVTAQGPSDVAYCSVTPVNAKRWIDVCVLFDGARYEVASAALPRIELASSLNEVLKSDVAVSRDFNQYDRTYLDKYSAKVKADGKPAYVKASP